MLRKINRSHAVLTASTAISVLRVSERAAQTSVPLSEAEAREQYLLVLMPSRFGCRVAPLDADTAPKKKLLR